MAANHETVQQVLDDLALAGRALKHLPPERLVRFGTWWPNIVYDSHEAYGYAEERVPRSAATPEEVDALDRVLTASLSFDASDRRLVLARAMGFSWRRIMQERRRRGEGLRHQSLKRLFRECVYRLANAYVEKAA